MENYTNLPPEKQDANQEKERLQYAAKKIQHAYQKYKMTKNLEQIHQKILGIINIEENKDPKILIEKENLEQTIKEIFEMMDNTIDMYKKLPMAKKINIKIDKIKETKQILQKYINGDRNMTAQYIAVALSNLLPVIFKIQQASVLALQDSAYNPLIGPKGQSLARKVFITCLITSGVIVITLWGMQTAGIAIVDFTPFISFFEKVLNIDQLTALFYG